MKHKGKRLFITGIPTAGKSHLAKLLSDKTGGIAVLFDDFREALAQNDDYKKWTNWYLEKDEEEYLTKTSSEKHWQDLVAQSEGLWPAFVEEINKYSEEEKPVIFECVNIMPHLANKDFDFPGIALIGYSLEETIERNKKDPRWGTVPVLQELLSKIFFEVERPRYKIEAEKYGWAVYEKVDEALAPAIKLLS